MNSFNPYYRRQIIHKKLLSNNYVSLEDALDEVFQNFPNDNNNKALKLYIMNYDK